MADDLVLSSNDLALVQTRGLLDHLTDAVLVTTPEGVITDCNVAAERIFGWSRDELIGANRASLDRSERAPELWRSIQAAVARDGRWFGEIGFVRKDASAVVCETTATALGHAPGEAFAMLTVHHDITARQELERKLVDERNILRTLIDTLPDMIFVKDAHGRFVLHNAASDRTWQIRGENPLGKTVLEMPSLKEHARLYEADDRRVLATGEPVINREEPHALPQGEQGWLLTSKLPLRDARGQTIGIIGIARDITAQKKVERALADERETLRTVIDAIPDPLFVKDRAGRHVVENLAHRRAFRRDTTPAGATVFELHPPEYARLYAADDETVMCSGEPLINREEPYLTPFGERGWFLTSKFPLRDSAGAVTGLVGICRDITALKRAAEELACTRQRLVDHVENSPLAVLEWGADFRVRRWTGQAQNMFGWRAAEVVGKHFKEWAFVYPDDMERVTEVAAGLIDGREQRNISHNRNFNSAGAVLHCVWHNSVVREGSGQTVSILSLVQDVTERVLAEQTIRENERLYHTLVGATNTGYAFIDERGFILDANEEYVRLTGRDSRQQVVGHCVTDWTALHDLERHTREVALCVQGSSIRNVELDYVTPDGRIVPVEMNARTQETTAGPRIVVFCRDISLRRRAEAERRVVDRRLQEKQKLESLGVLAGGIAHDFNNLLTGILGNASLAAADAGSDTPLRQFLEQIETAAMRAGDLCHQMLAYAGKGRFLIRPLDLNAVIEETINLLRISIKKNAVLSSHLTPELPPILADATQMRQIIMNLVINASEAIADPSGTIVVATSVVHADKTCLAATHLAPDLPEGIYVAIEVRDDGAGMYPEIQARIFDPFFTTKFTGRGLGLAAVLGIVRGHRGALLVESEPGKGSTFRVLLPVAEGVVEKEIAPQTLDADRWHGSGKVLVIDDEEAVRTTTAALLELLGFTALIAPDGRAGVEVFAAAAEEIRLVLLDLTMPHFNGEETLREIRRIKADARVLLMSGFTEEEVARRFEGQELAGFLPKPFMLSTLRKKVHEILGG